MNLELTRSIIQKTYRGVTPSRTITAPEPCDPVYSMLSEQDRLAQFEYSRRFHELRAKEPINVRRSVDLRGSNVRTLPTGRQVGRTAAR